MTSLFCCNADGLARRNVRRGFLILSDRALGAKISRVYRGRTWNEMPAAPVVAGQSLQRASNPGDGSEDEAAA